AASGGSGAAKTGQPPSPDADFPNVDVRILWNGDRAIWTVNGAPIGCLAELQQMLSGISRIKADAPVVLDPASDVPLGDVIDVFDLSRLVGFQKIQFAASAAGLGGRAAVAWRLVLHSIDRWLGPWWSRSLCRHAHSRWNRGLSTA